MRELLKKINLIYHYDLGDVFVGPYYSASVALWMYDKSPLNVVSAARLDKVNELIASGLITETQARQLLGLK